MALNHAARFHLRGERGDERSRVPARISTGRFSTARSSTRAPIRRRERQRQSEAREKMLRELERRRARQQQRPSNASPRMNARAPLPGESRAALRFLAAAVALRAFAVVRAQVPVLRFQLVRSARHAAGSRVRRRVAARLAQRAAVRAGPRDRDDVLRRRHAEPVLRRGDRALARRAAEPSRAGPDVEITLEANPGAVDAARFAAFREAGVNRLSIGIQSFRNEQLRALGRVHDAAQARSGRRDGARGRVRQPQPRSDVRPAERRRRWRRRGSRARDRARAGTHLLVPADARAEHGVRAPPAGAARRRRRRRIEERGRALLAAHGYARYEISAYARPGRRCRHNLNYWQFGDYLGLGAGAHGKVTLPPSRRDRAPRQDAQPAHLPAASGQRPTRSREERVARRRASGARVPHERAARCSKARPSRCSRRAPASLSPRLRRRAPRQSRAAGSRAEPGSLRATPAGIEKLNRLLELFA